MAQGQVGNIAVNFQVVGGKGQNNLDADNLDSIAAMRARLTAINATSYSAARLNAMTKNDMIYAIRLHDHGATVK